MSDTAEYLAIVKSLIAELKEDVKDIKKDQADLRSVINDMRISAAEQKVKLGLIIAGVSVVFSVIVKIVFDLFQKGGTP